ncbi:glycosyltransferase [Hoeflea prorocentri]|uniref:Glycosyltransferase family 4 protein n=1 Tax=Hoeflea prorocentri TaxID=1922333 RepID=A0A9X3UK08_9HYPH|nr:glycosyltransferase family 4 protein [Hoeflea prorocentri]MCY6380226.1 glycosyltransferase family 4 protein [Hoeflea prorocentri]MDA5398026.1 glycosyltransferase family 4 protein [Hoeflea prorocentri]
MPARSGNGLAMRCGMFTEALARLGATEVIVVGGQDTVLDEGEIEGVSARVVSTAGRLDTRLRLISQIENGYERAEALRALGRPSSTAVLSAPVIKDVAEWVAQKQWSGIVVSRSYLTPLLNVLRPIADRVPLLVDLDDDDALMLRERAAIARSSNNSQKAAVLEAEADCYEKVIQSCSGHVVTFCSSSEATSFQLKRRLQLSNVVSIPNGIEVPEKARVSAERHTLLFVGNLAYQPNVDGISWFVSHVWQRVRERFPDVELVVAGSNPSSRLAELCHANEVTLESDPVSISPHYTRARAVVIPLRTGAGTRIKLLEAGAHNVPVISTSKGAEGLDVLPDKHFYCCDYDPEEMLSACTECLSSPVEAMQKAEELHAMVCRNYGRSDVIGTITELVQSIIKPTLKQ